MAPSISTGGGGAAGKLASHPGRPTRADRERLLGQRGCAVWLTGLSGSGKSTIARALEADLADSGNLVYVLDGDDIRRGLNSDLGFGEDDRRENIRRLAEVAALFVDAGVVTVTAFISPYARDRALARGTVGGERFIEVFVDTPLAVCEERDPKGLYARARAGAIESFTGISAPYEAPEAPDLRLDTSSQSPEESAAEIAALLAARNLVRGPRPPERPTR